MEQIAQVITPEKVLLIAIFLLVAFPVHEFCHALVAHQLGDSTAKLFGRLTFDPRAHFDPFGAAMLVISVLFSGFAIGWAKPTPVNPANLRDRRNGEVLVALAGPASNLVMAALAALVFRALNPNSSTLPDWVFEILILFVIYNVALAIFNVVPIPPLDGASLLTRFLPYRYRYTVVPFLAQYGLLVLIFIIVTPVGQVFGQIVFRVARFLVGG